MNHSLLKVFAGSDALAHIRENGLCSQDIQMILAASGGPKWLSLYAMDRYFLQYWFHDRKEPLDLLGTSAGSWRMACYAQREPLKAIKRFFDEYLEQQYSDKPSAQEVAGIIAQSLDAILGEKGAEDIISNTVVRYHTIVTRCRGLAAVEQKQLQMLGFLGAMTANVFARSAMRPWIQRTLFHHPAGLPHIEHFPYFPPARVPLSEDNLRQAMLATGSVPIVIQGVRNIPGAPKGTYRDGGITDYQFDLPVLPEEGFVLYPHYFAKSPTGGWFDKRLRWRTVSREHYRRTIIIAPSWEFAATLPGGRIPDMEDFYEFKYAERRQRWDIAVKACEQLAEELAEIDQSQRWAEVAEPLPW